MGWNEVQAGNEQRGLPSWLHWETSGQSIPIWFLSASYTICTSLLTNLKCHVNGFNFHVQKPSYTPSAYRRFKLFSLTFPDPPNLHLTRLYNFMPLCSSNKYSLLAKPWFQPSFYFILMIFFPPAIPRYVVWPLSFSQQNSHQVLS